MAAPRGPASRAMMNPSAVSSRSRSKIISHPGLSGNKLTMRRSKSFTGRGMPSDPAILTLSRANQIDFCASELTPGK
jgi:hypothetical protein